MTNNQSHCVVLLAKHIVFLANLFDLIAHLLNVLLFGLELLLDGRVHNLRVISL